MPDCPKCGKHLGRKHRHGFQKLIYRDAFKCGKCGFFVGVRRAPLNVRSWFVASRHSRCIRCGNTDVHRSRKRDHIDTVSHHPISVLLHLTGAPIVRCFACRLQYYDWRRPASH
jgi:hypothetical protein